MSVGLRRSILMLTGLCDGRLIWRRKIGFYFSVVLIDALSFRLRQLATAGARVAKINDGDDNEDGDDDDDDERWYTITFEREGDVTLKQRVVRVRILRRLATPQIRLSRALLFNATAQTNADGVRVVVRQAAAICRVLKIATRSRLQQLARCDDAATTSGGGGDIWMARVRTPNASTTAVADQTADEENFGGDAQLVDYFRRPRQVASRRFGLTRAKTKNQRL